MIEKLTKLQEKQLIEFREECLGYGLSCEKININKSKELINKAYGYINKKPNFIRVPRRPGYLPRWRQ